MNAKNLRIALLSLFVLVAILGCSAQKTTEECIDPSKFSDLKLAKHKFLQCELVGEELVRRYENNPEEYENAE